MPVTINASGYIEVYRDGVFVSRHNVESNAIEAIVAHAEANGDGDYELRYPNKVVMSRLRKQVVPFSWNPITLAFVNGTAASVNLAGFLANPENRAVSYSVTGTLPTGVTLTGSTVSYNGTGAVASASVRFNATWGGLTAVSNPSTVSVNAAAPANRVPVFTVAPTTATIPTTGGTIQFTASDPDADVLTYTLPSPPAGYSINSATGLVTVAAGAASGSITVRATDPQGLYTVSPSCSVTVQAVTGPTYTPILRTNYAGVVGQRASEITGSVGAYYSSAILGPFGEATVARFPVTAGGYTFGGIYSGIPIGASSFAEGDEIWIRQYTYFPATFCAGSASGGDFWGYLKYLRIQFGSTIDAGTRLTFQLGGLTQNQCALAANAPYAAGATREGLPAGANMWFASPVVIPRNQWAAMQYYVRFSAGSSGLIRGWMGTQFLGEVSGATMPSSPASQVFSCIYVGNYWNGGIYQTCEFYHGDTIITRQAPNTLDGSGRPYISPSTRATDFT